MARGTRGRPGPAAPQRIRAGPAKDSPTSPGPDARPQAAGLTRALAPGSTGPVSAPVIVLTYGFAGGRRLQDLLSREPDLACTARTGILGAVGQVAAAWQYAEDRGGDQMSALAATSVRALVNSMLTVVTARMGSRRWCETAAVDPVAAAAFLQAFPETRIICLHRACPDVVFGVLATRPWGLSGAGFASYVASHPASTAAALAAWWADQAGPLLEFEAAYQRACLRVRYEDLVTDAGQALAAVRCFLGLDRGPGADTPEPGTAGTIATGPDAVGCGDGFPVGQLPPRLTDRVNALHAQLGYRLLSVS